MKRSLHFVFLTTTLCLLTTLSGCVGKRHQPILMENSQDQKSATSHHADDNENVLGLKSTYVCEDISRFVNKKVGNGECVDLLKACASTPSTDQWQKGKTVWGHSIPTGTAIATFKQSKYPNKNGYHAAIYVSQDEKGVYVWDQWRGKNVHLRLIRFDQSTKVPGNDATQYSVITQ